MEGVHVAQEAAAPPRQQYLPNVACCLCGISMQPNPSRMCVSCLRSQVDVTEGISRQLVVQQCKGCLRWQKPPFVHCEPESRELLALCLKKIKGLNKVRLVDASFLWTEPNSKRLKVKISVQKEVINGAVLQQSAVVDFVTQSVQCPECKRSFTPHLWNANVQVRQKVLHKRSLLYLEQLILRNDAHEKVIHIQDSVNGFDFQFHARQHAERFSDFVGAVFPVRKTLSKQLISHDGKSNTYYHKHTIFLELCPICKDDMVYLPPELTSRYGGLPKLMLCSKMSTSVHLLDPLTLRMADIPVEKYWKAKFDAVLTRQHLSDFIVLDVDTRSMGTADSQQQTVKGQPFCHYASRAGKYRLAQIEVARASDFGVNDQRVVVLSHLGNVLKPGDYCQGYDLRYLNINMTEKSSTGDGEQNLKCDVILIKKVRPPGKPKATRSWTLQTLRKDKVMGGTGAAAGGSDERPTKESKRAGTGGHADAADMEAFMNDLEENPDLRREVNLWKDPRLAGATPSGGAEVVGAVVDDDDEFGKVDIAELLEGLTLEDREKPLNPQGADDDLDDEDVEM